MHHDHPIRTSVGALLLAAGGFLGLPAAAEGLPVKAPERADAVRFEAEIRPFLAANCTACHNEKIKEGGLRLDSVAALVAGGDSGPGVTAGKGAESVVFLRATHRLDDAMPPADNKVGAKNLTPEQLGLLERWINEGAQAGPAATRGPITWRPVPAGQGGVLAAAFSADGRVAAAARGGRVSLFDTASGRLLGALVDPTLASAAAGVGDLAHLDVIQSLALSPADERIATGSFRTVKLWRRTRPGQAAALADSAQATAVALAPAGSPLALGRADGQIVVVDPLSGAVQRVIVPHTAAVTGLSFSADGARLFSASRDGSLAATTVADGTVTGRLKRPGEVHALARLADDRIAAADADGVVRVWPLPLPAPDADPAAAPAAIKELNGGGQPIAVLATVPAPAGHLLAGGADGTVRLWNIEGANVVRQFAHGGAVTALAVRPDGARLATVGTVPGVKLWDLASGQPAGEWKGDHRLVDRLRVVDVDLAVRKQDVEYGKARVTEAEKGIEAAAAETKQTAEKLAAAEKTMGEKGEAAKTSLATKEEADRVVAAATAAVPQATEAQAAAVKAQAAAALAVESATASANAFAAVAASSAGDAAAAETLKTFQSVAAGATAAKAAADQAVAQAAQQIERSKARVDEMTKKAAEAAKGATAAAEALKQAETAVTSAKRAVEFAAQQTARADEAVPARKAELAAAESQAGAVEQARSAAEAARVAAEKPLLGVSYSADGAWIVATGADGAAFLLGGQDGLPRDAWEPGGEGGRGLVTFLDASRVVVAGGAAPGAVWTCTPAWIHERSIGGETLPPVSDEVAGGPPVDVVTSLAFSPDGALLASGGGRPSRSGEIKLWNVADGALVRELTNPHSDTVVALEFSRAGDLLASGGTDRFVKVHTVADGKHVKSFEGHTGHVLGVAWQAHGRRLASAGADASIKVWDVVSGEQQRTITGLKKEATAIRFLPPGEEVAAASGDPTVRIYNAGNGGTVRNFDGVGDFVQVLTAAPGWVAAGCQDGKLRIWSAADGKLVQTLEPAPAKP
jgi:WD40 repeat protein